MDKRPGTGARIRLSCWSRARSWSARPRSCPACRGRSFAASGRSAPWVARRRGTPPFVERHPAAVAAPIVELGPSRPRPGCSRGRRRRLRRRPPRRWRSRVAGPESGIGEQQRRPHAFLDHVRQASGVNGASTGATSRRRTAGTRPPTRAICQPSSCISSRNRAITSTYLAVLAVDRRRHRRRPAPRWAVDVRRAAVRDRPVPTEAIPPSSITSGEGVRCRRTLGGRRVAPFGEVRQSRRRRVTQRELLFVDLRSRVQ